MTDQLRTVWQFAMSGGLVFGRGAADHAGSLLVKRSASKALIVTDANLTRLGVVDRIVHSLARSGLSASVFAECVAEPPLVLAEQAATCGRLGQVDCVVGIGGGSNIDVAKMAAILLTYGGNPRDYFGFDRVPGPVMPLAAIPTTAGTGSEVSHSAVLTDLEKGTKVSSLSQWLRPAMAIVDPNLSDSCPTIVTAHSGIDALVHAIEAVTARPFTQMANVDAQSRAYEGAYALTELLAGAAIVRIGRSLVRACKDGRDREARDDMALAATLAGMAFSNSGVAIVHALEYPLGVLTHCSHGEGNGLLLPHAMRYNLDAARGQFEKIAGWLAPCNRDHVAEDAIELVERLQKEIGIRTRLRDLGLQREQLSPIAATAFQIKRLMDTNPRQPTEADLMGILEAAF